MLDIDVEAPCTLYFADILYNQAESIFGFTQPLMPKPISPYSMEEGGNRITKIFRTRMSATWDVFMSYQKGGPPLQFVTVDDISASVALPAVSPRVAGACVDRTKRPAKEELQPAHDRAIQVLQYIQERMEGLFGPAAALEDRS
jgi:hypothetical protein